MAQSSLSSSTLWTLTVTLILLSMGDFASSSKYTYDMEIKYFSNGHLKCDHPKLNITKRSDVESLSWIFEDGSLVTPKSYLNRRQYILGGLPDGVVGATVPKSRYDGYNLTVLEVDDDVFGYYTCIVMFTSSPDHPRLAVIRYGLNVDGADFSDLLADYRHNAMVGGIAAGAMLVLMGIACYIWYYYCNDKLPEDLEEGDVDGIEMGVKGGEMKDNSASFHNEGFKGDKSDIEKDNDVKDNGQDSSVRL